MTLSLSPKTVDAIVGLQNKLLAAAFIRERQRLVGLLKELCDLIDAKRSFAAYLEGQEMVFRAYRVGPQIEVYLKNVFRGVDRDGNLLLADPELEEINKRRRQMGAGVHHENRLQDRRIIEKSRFFVEAFAPAGMHHVIGLSTPLSVGEAVFAFGFEGPEDPGFANNQSSDILRLLLPAFGKGFRTALQPTTAAPLPEEPARQQVGDDWAKLTPRQIDVAELIMQGMTDPQIGETLGIATNTARRHSEAVLKRLDLTSRSGLATRLGYGRTA